MTSKHTLKSFYKMLWSIERFYTENLSAFCNCKVPRLRLKVCVECTKSIFWNSINKFILLHFRSGMKRWQVLVCFLDASHHLYTIRFVRIPSCQKNWILACFVQVWYSKFKTNSCKVLFLIRKHRLAIFSWFFLFLYVCLFYQSFQYHSFSLRLGSLNVLNKIQ